ncbi:MAG: hypothetical protein GC159_23875 [Phycisphaera sp.]|nr:hypothetical protein [Phycisphaera sp.]
MGYDDRHYADGFNDGPDGGSFFGKLSRLLMWSFPVGTYFDIAVRVNFWFIPLFVGRLMYDVEKGGMDVLPWSFRWMAVMFFSVLLHEFGHCFACRAVGGQANDILMWPLGGLAMCLPPRRPWPEFVTVVWGPLVTLILALGSFGILVMVTGEWLPVSLNPLTPWRSRPEAGISGLVEDTFLINYILLLFNLALLFYPFDGGRLVQVALWKKLGYFKSMVVATGVGMGGAILIGMLGLSFGELMIVLVAVFGFITCYQQRKQLKMAGPGAFMDDHGESWKTGKMTFGDYHVDDEDSEGFFERRRRLKAEARRAKQRAAQEALDAEIDRILEKVSEQGMQSLSAKEKRTLQTKTEQERKAK